MSGLRHGAAQRRLAAHKHGCRLEIRPGGLAPPPLIIPQRLPGCAPGLHCRKVWTRSIERHGSRPCTAMRNAPCIEATQAGRAALCIARTIAAGPALATRHTQPATVAAVAAGTAAGPAASAVQWLLLRLLLLLDTLGPGERCAGHPGSRSPWYQHVRPWPGHCRWVECTPERRCRCCAAGCCPSSSLQAPPGAPVRSNATVPFRRGAQVAGACAAGLPVCGWAARSTVVQYQLIAPCAFRGPR